MKKFFPIRLFFVFIFSLFLFLLNSAFAFADTYTITTAADGGDCTKIGTWSADTLTCTMTQDLQGSSVVIDGDHIIFDGAGHVVGGSSLLDIEVMAQEGSGITIKNLQIQNGDVGIVILEDAKNSKIENVTITASGYGVEIFGPKDFSFSDHHSTISGSTFSQNAGGVKIFHSAEDVLQGNTFANNENAVSLYNATSTTISSNHFEKNTEALDLYTVTNVSISQNSMSENGDAIIVYGGAENHFVGNTISRSKSSGVTMYGSEKDVFTLNTWKENGVGLLLYGDSNGGNAFYRNNFIDNGESLKTYKDLSQDSFFQTIPSKDYGGNYWSDFDTAEEGCQDTNADGFCDDPYSIINDNSRERVSPDRFAWTKPNGWENQCVKGCYSNVAFIPGIEGSRLYTDGFIGSNQLWKPNRNADVEKLYMDDQGKSINHVFVGEPIDQVYGVGENIYKGYMDFMDGLVSDGTIEGWQPLPYDWRYDVRDVVKYPIILESGAYSMVDRIEKLAKTSKTGKVTIVAHSNGGLVGKALISALVAKGEGGLIDQFIMVGTPQLGTPEALPVLLHGEDQEQGHGFIVNKATGRKAALTMPGAYGLLPFPDYFQAVNTIAQPLIKFDPKLNTSEIKNLENFYGGQIDSESKMDQFLLGADGRSQAAFSDTEHPSIVNPVLLSKEQNTQQFLENWTAPSNVQITQIAGWGLKTIQGITYTEPLGCAPELTPCVRIPVDGFWYEPDLTMEGDGTVVSSSAVADKNVKTYYLKLDDYNERELSNVKHGNILEVLSLQNLIKELIEKSPVENFPYISDTKPLVDPSKESYQLSVHSPVSLSATDENGNCTGLVDNPNPDSDIQLVSQEIPNSYYMEFGEGKYLGFGGGESHTIALHGLDYGTFTFDITEVDGDEETKTISYQNIPVTPDTIAVMNIQSLSSHSPLEIDLDGDGTSDFSLEDGNQSLDPVTYVSFIEKSLVDMHLQNGIEKSTGAQLENLKRTLQKPEKKGKNSGKDTSKLLKDIDQLSDKITRDQMHGKIPAKQAEVLIKELGILKGLVE
ncbi:MAG TPA: NosD domain-containing protein [Candidatus Paceibacterota bacterium]|nr:NosD domain-containing protein [Candidatus Paceibacterota bacterium]